MEILKFIFSSGWIFIGCVILLCVIGEIIVEIIDRIKR